MFSGIVESTGKILALQKGKQGGASLLLDAGTLARSLKSGDSIAVDGICLTVVKKSGRKIGMDISEETLVRTNLHYRKRGQEVNLELPLSMMAVVSGHLVQGHIEGLASVKKWIRNGKDVRLILQLPSDLMDYCIPKGSIALNGVSLTIASMSRRTIEIALIPYTLEVTNLNELRPGDFVNVETDMLGRYVVTMVKKIYDTRKESAE
jgi:riboflavin synthase